jgi:RNA polymerase sigma-70 factor (ECF subfamily)
MGRVSGPEAREGDPAEATSAEFSAARYTVTDSGIRAVPGGASAAEHARRVHALVTEYMDFVWRSLRRLGVAEADCDDGCQRVWVVVAHKVATIDPEKVRSYIFSVVLRVASDLRRSHRRHQHLEFDERLESPVPADTEGMLERREGRQVLDQLLSGLSWDLRTVFVMFEIEGLSSPEIAGVLGISRGTVASRLRLARAAFQRVLSRYQARAASTVEAPGQGKNSDPRARGC